MAATALDVGSMLKNQIGGVFKVLRANVLTNVTFWAILKNVSFEVKIAGQF